MGHDRFDTRKNRPHWGAEEVTGEVQEWTDGGGLPEVTVQAATAQSRQELEEDELFARTNARELPPKPKKAHGPR